MTEGNAAFYLEPLTRLVVGSVWYEPVGTSGGDNKPCGN